MEDNRWKDGHWRVEFLQRLLCASEVITEIDNFLPGVDKNILTLGKGSGKKTRKNCALLTNRGGGVSKKRKNANLYFGKVFFRSLSGTNKHYLLRGLPF